MASAGASAGRGGRAVPSERAISTFVSNTDSTPDIHRWTEQYIAQAVDHDGGAGGSGGDGGAPFILPIMGLKKVKVPTETVQLQIFEPRYRLLFRLVNQSRSKRFGVALVDAESGLMEPIGTLCDLTHYIPVGERRRVFVSARAVGRYEIQPGGLISAKPFAAARCLELADRPPAGLAEAAQLAALERRVWDAMNEVRELTTKLFAAADQAPFGDEVFQLETRRWCPDPAVRSAVPCAPGSDPVLMQACEEAGLLGEAPAGGVREGAREHICSDARRQFSDGERRERLSFALLRALDVGEAGRHGALLGRSTAERLRVAEQLVLEGRAHLAARSVLKDMF